jgi:hypothetical protein
MGAEENVCVSVSGRVEGWYHFARFLLEDSTLDTLFQEGFRAVLFALEA